MGIHLATCGAAIATTIENADTKKILYPYLLQQIDTPNPAVNAVKNLKIRPVNVCCLHCSELCQSLG